MSRSVTYKPVVMLLAVLILALQCGCSHKDILCPGNEPRTLTVRFMWDHAPKAEPAGMTAYFFPLSEGTRMWRFDIAGRDGGTVELPPGEYRFLAVNNDLPGVLFGGQDSFDTFSARARGAGASGVLGSTGMLYGCTVERVEVTICGINYITQEGMVKECRKGLLRCSPDSLSTVYNVILRQCTGLDKVKSVTGLLHGVAPELLVAEDMAQGAPQALAVNMSASGSTATGTTLTGAAAGFGAPAGREPAFTLEVRATRHDGKVITKSFDVTSQVINSINPKNVFIILEGIDFPDAAEPPGPDDDVGIEVGVDGWHVIEIEFDTSLP